MMMASYANSAEDREISRLASAQEFPFGPRLAAPCQPDQVEECHLSTAKSRSTPPSSRCAALSVYFNTNLVGTLVRARRVHFFSATFRTAFGAKAARRKYRTRSVLLSPEPHPNTYGYPLGSRSIALLLASSILQTLVPCGSKRDCCSAALPSLTMGATFFRMRRFDIGFHPRS